MNDVSKADLRHLWRQADEKFQQHRTACMTCRWNLRRHSLAVLCEDGQRLHGDAERLLALLNHSTA